MSVLSSKQMSCRWRDCNPQQSPSLEQADEDEDEWRSQMLELLTSIHTLGGIINLMFDIVESRNAVRSSFDMTSLCARY